MKEPLHIAAIGDIHGCLKNTYIPKCDVLTISGDFSELCLDDVTGRLCGWITNKFLPWMIGLPCNRVIFIPGNHDFITEHAWFRQWFNTQLEIMDKNYPSTNEDNNIIPIIVVSSKQDKEFKMDLAKNYVEYYVDKMMQLEEKYNALERGENIPIERAIRVISKKENMFRRFIAAIRKLLFGPAKYGERNINVLDYSE